MRRYLFLLLGFVLGLSAIAQQVPRYTFINATDSRIAYVGRTLHQGTKVLWTYPGVQLHANFQGNLIGMVTKPKCGFFIVQIDGGEPYKVEVGEDSLTILAQDLSNGDHRLCLTYAVEGLLFKPELESLVLGAKNTLGARPRLPQRKLEFIGNSITCGYGIEDTVGMKKFSYSTQNVWRTYEAITARELQAQCQIVARSGIGIYRNCNGNRQGDRNTMQALYPYTLFGTSGARWDFSRYQPDVVCVNLGTNDTTSPGYETSLLAAAYKKFLRTLRSHYPHAKIVLLTGTMLQGRRLSDVKQAQQQAVDDARSRGDNQIFRFDFTPEDGSMGYGTHKHPSLRRHAQMAQELIPFLRRITGWD